MTAKRCWCSPTCETPDTYQRIAAGFCIGLSTAWRYIHETVDLLAAAATVEAVFEASPPQGAAAGRVGTAGPSKAIVRAVAVYGEPPERLAGFRVG